MTRSLHDLTNELDLELLSEHRFDTELFRELTAFEKGSGILHGERAICPFLRPYFLAESRYNAIRYTAAHLYQAFAAITEAALEYPEIMTVLGMSEKEERWARLDTGYKDVSVTSRLDTFLSPDGFAFLEYNGETPAGIGDQAALERLFTDVPEVKRFLADNSHFYPQPHFKLLESLDASYREAGGKKEKPNIAIVDWAGVDTRFEFVILMEFFESQGYSTKICDPEELEYTDGVLKSGSFDIDVFYKRVIIHEFLERYDEENAVYQACLDGAVCMANSFRSKVPHKKASFAILTDERYHKFFDAEQLEAIRLHVPWTRVVEFGRTKYVDEDVDLIEFIRRERHRFVLKPNDDYGGKGINFGWESTELEWDEAIENALGAKYIVQERVAVEKTNIPVFSDGEARMESLTVDFDPFLFRGVVEGGMVRLAAGSLVNISSGGGETALAILKGF